jgi:hypothetical protein
MIGVTILENFVVSTLFFPVGSAVPDLIDFVYIVAYNVFWFGLHLAICLCTWNGWFYLDSDTVRERGEKVGYRLDIFNLLLLFDN